MTNAKPGFPPRIFVLVEVDDDGKAHRTFYETEKERERETLNAIWFGGPDQCHAEEAAACLEELREKGSLYFEGDAPLHWEECVPAALLSAAEAAKAEAVKEARAQAFKEVWLAWNEESFPTAEFTKWLCECAREARAPESPTTGGEE